MTPDPAYVDDPTLPPIANTVLRITGPDAYSPWRLQQLREEYARGMHTTTVSDLQRPPGDIRDSHALNPSSATSYSSATKSSQAGNDSPQDYAVDPAAQAQAPDNFSIVLKSLGVGGSPETTSPLLKLQRQAKLVFDFGPDVAS
jgi:hypothetical protein